MYDPLLPLRHRALWGKSANNPKGPHVSVGGQGVSLAWGETGLPRPGPPAGVLVGRVRVDFYRSFGSFLVFVGFLGVLFVVSGVSWWYICCFWGFLNTGCG